MKTGDIGFIGVMALVGLGIAMGLGFLARQSRIESQLERTCRDRCWPQVVQLCSIDHNEMKLDTVYCFTADGGVERR